MIASSFIGDGQLWLYLDDKLIMKNSDAATVDLEGEGEYILHWFVMGSPGASYSLTISSPREAQYQLTKVIGKGGKDGGELRFTS